MTDETRRAHCFWPSTWGTAQLHYALNEDEQAERDPASWDVARCRRTVKLTRESSDLWATWDRVLVARGEESLSADETAVCEEHMPHWLVWRRVLGEKREREGRRLRAFADYEKLCKENHAPPPVEYFSQATMQRYENRIRDMYRQQRGVRNHDI